MVESDFIDHSHDGFWNESPEELAEYGVVTDTYDPDQMFVEWLQSVTPEGKTVVYHGNQYQGTGTGRTSSPVDKIKPIALEGTEASQNAEGKPITLENSNASQNAEGINKSETKEASTLEKTETGNETSSDKIDDADSFEWVTHLNDESDTKDKANTKNTDTTKGEKSQYPNGMTQEEFNSMYEFALGMSGKGENTENGIWGPFETLPLKIPELTKELAKYERAGNETKANAAREQLANAKEQLSSLESFISNYKDIYSPIKEKTKSEYKKDMDAAGESALRTYADLSAANGQVDTIQGGFDYKKHQFTPGQKEYTDSYGNEYTTDISIFGDKVNITTAVYSADGEFGKSYIQTTNDYKGLEEALSKAVENENNIETKYYDLVEKYNDAKASFESAKEVTKQDIMDAWAAGKLNPYQAAVALTKTDDHSISFKYDAILSNIDYDNFSGTIAGSRGDGTVGINSFISDITGPDITAGEKEASPTNISKEITEEFVSLNDMKDRLNKIDVSNIKSKEQAETLSNDLSNYLSDLSVKAHNELQTLVTSLLETGGQLQNVRNDPKFKTLSTGIYTLAQAVYDKTSAIEEYTGKYFGDIDISSRRAIKKNIREISDKIAEMQGAEHIVHTDSKGRTSFVLNSEEVKALANYGKTIDATKDAAIALMKSAAFNGAENVTGDKYSEAWKSKIAVTSDDKISKQTVKDTLKDIASGFFGTKDSGKLTFGDFLASGTKGMLGVVTASLGIAAIPYNPVLGTILTYAGVNSVGREILKFGTDVARSSTTNEEAMFGQNYDKGKQVWNEIYNRSFEKANYGDPKSVATWTAAVGIIGGLVEMMAGGVGIADGIVRIKQNVEILANRGLSGNVDTTIQNVYNLGENIITWSNMNLNINDYMKNPDQALIYKGKNVNTLTDDDISIKPNYATYGTATSDDSSVLDNKYSGYTEQAKNSNLAKDYNAGMEKDVNEAVSDKYVKVFKVMFDKEPDYIRKVLIAIPKNHFEMGW